MSAAPARMRLVCLSPYVPHPRINHAGGRFLLDYLPRMAAHADVTLVAPASPDNVVAAAYAPEEIHVHLFPGLPTRRLLARGLRRDPVDALVGISHGVLMRSALEADAYALEAIAAADVVEVQFAQYLPLLDSVRQVAPRTPLTAHEHDVFADLVRANVTAQATRARRLRARAQVWRVPKEERRLLDMCSLVITHNPKDKRVLRELGVRTAIEAVYPPVTIPAHAAPVRGAQVSFVGAMWRLENRNAVQWFLDNVWPAVLAAVPEARFVVAGDSPAGWLRELTARPNAAVTGFLPSLDPVYQDTTVAVAPLLGSQGIKVKALQSMAFGLPVVATRAGAAGIAEEAGEGVFAGISDEPARFAGHVVACLRDLDSARAIGTRAREWVLANCDFDATVERIAALYLALPPADHAGS